MNKRGGKNSRRHADMARNSSIAVAAWANALLDSGISISAFSAEPKGQRSCGNGTKNCEAPVTDSRVFGSNEKSFLPPPTLNSAISAVELHSHSTFSDGHLSPSALVHRAAQRGVKVLALTDHDTMAGVREAMRAGLAHGVRIIPGVEISASSAPRGSQQGSGLYNVHILAYFGLGGPATWRDLEACLEGIRIGRFGRAQQMVANLNEIGVPLSWQNVLKFTVGGGAPGRRHVAMALVEAGHVSCEKEAFSKYIGDDGLAYASGAEPCCEDVVALVAAAGGVSVVAHPWSIKRGNGYQLLQRLQPLGLLGVEVYKEPRTQFQHYREWADALGLLKIGGSDFHGRGGNEADIGSCPLPPQAAWDFVGKAERVWAHALRERIERVAKAGTSSEVCDRPCVGGGGRKGGGGE